MGEGEVFFHKFLLDQIIPKNLPKGRSFAAEPDKVNPAFCLSLPEAAKVVFVQAYFN